MTISQIPTTSPYVHVTCHFTQWWSWHRHQSIIGTFPWHLPLAQWYNLCGWCNIIIHINNTHQSQLHHTQSELPVYVGTITDKATRQSLKYHDIIQLHNYHDLLTNLFAKEVGHLAKWYKTIPGTNNIFFINKYQLSANHKVTYGWIVMSYRPQKLDPLCTQLTIGCNKLDYPWDASTATADIMTSKLLLTSSISTLGIKFSTADKKELLPQYTPWPIWIHVPTPLHHLHPNTQAI